MNQLYEGLTLMLVGMTTVFIFLSLLVLVLVASSKIILKFWPDKVPEFSGKATDSNNKAMADDEQQRLTAVISAAIHQYRNSHKE